MEMARLRTIKPSFFTNEDLVTVDPLGRLLFIGLWCWADREGRLEDRPARLKIQIMPADDCDVVDLLDQLERTGFIARYEVEGARYIHVVNFHKHQRPHVKESPSELPAPPNVVLSTNLGDAENAPSSVFRLPSSVNRLLSSVNGDSPVVEPGANAPLLEKISDEKLDSIEAVAKEYKQRIHTDANLTEKARAKIKTRLKTYSVEQLSTAMARFSADWWWVENNGRQGMAWFFDSDDRIEKFRNLIPRTKPTEKRYKSHDEMVGENFFDNIPPDSVEGRAMTHWNEKNPGMYPDWDPVVGYGPGGRKR